MKLVSNGAVSVGTICAAIIVAALFRVIPHPSNVAPIVSMALFGGACIADRRLAVAVVFGAMLVSDLVLGFHSTMLLVYPSLFAILVLGRVASEKRSALLLGSLTVGSSVFFFLTTNFGVWLLQDLYPRSFAGLVSCYVAAIPFFQNALLGDLCFSAVLFGSIALIERSQDSKTVLRSAR